jgi:hypothetical protein
MRPWGEFEDTGAIRPEMSGVEAARQLIELTH